MKRQYKATILITEILETSQALDLEIAFGTETV